MAENNSLFNEFNRTSNEEWEKAIEKSLKGKERSSIDWDGDLKLSPYYTENNFTETKPTQFPYRRGIKSNNNTWEIRENIVVSDAKKASTKALNALMNGSNSLGFSLEHADALGELLTDIVPEYISLNFSGNAAATDVLQFLNHFAKETNTDSKAISGCMEYAPIGHLTATGNWHVNEQDDLNHAAELIKLTASTLPLYRCLNVAGNNYANSGANTIQQLAFSIAEGVEYLSALTDKGILIDDITARMQFTTATGSSYFMEMAKVRALRMLWANAVKAYQPKYSCSTATFIHTETAIVNKSAMDKHTNLLRTTTEAMSAALGGTNSLSVLPFDSGFAEPTNFSQRVARNIQNILFEESFLDKVNDPAGGSYYVEEITNQLCEKAWALFQEIEAKGGLIASLKSGEIQTKIEGERKGIEAAIEEGTKVMIGVNKYPNEITEFEEPFLTKKTRHKSEIKPLIFSRFTESIEEKV